MKIAFLQCRTIKAIEDGDRRYLQRLRDTELKMGLIRGCIEEARPDLVIGPEYLFTGETSSLGQEERRKIVGDLEKLTQDTQTILIPGSLVTGKDKKFSNSTFVIRDGKVVGEVKKRAYSGYDHYYMGHVGPCYMNDRRSGFGPNPEHYVKRHLIEVDGKKFLIEICADHAYTVLRSEGRDSLYRRNRKNTVPIPKVADIQIVISQEVDHHFEDCPEHLFAKPGGLYIESNSYPPSSFVGRVNGQRVNTLFSSEGKEEVLVANI